MAAFPAPPGGDIERNPGPKSPFAGRGPMDLNVGFAEQTAARMQKCLESFQLWVLEAIGRCWHKLVYDPEVMCWALRGYGLHCFSMGLPRYLFVFAITAVQDRCPNTRLHMSIAWQIDRKWQAHEPGQRRAVLPATAVRAAVCLAALWAGFPGQEWAYWPSV